MIGMKCVCCCFVFQLQANSDENKLLVSLCVCIKSSVMCNWCGILATIHEIITIIMMMMISHSKNFHLHFSRPVNISNSWYSQRLLLSICTLLPACVLLLVLLLRFFSFSCRLFLDLISSRLFVSIVECSMHLFLSLSLSWVCCAISFVISSQLHNRFVLFSRTRFTNDHIFSFLPFFRRAVVVVAVRDIAQFREIAAVCK